MKKNISTALLVFSLFLLNACSSKQFISAKQRSSLEQNCSKIIQKSKDDKTLNKILNEQIFKFQETVEEVLVSNRKSTIMLDRLLKQEQNNQPISARQLDSIFSSIEDDTVYVKRLAVMLNANTCWRSPVYDNLLGSNIRIKGSLFELAMTLFLYDFYLNTAYRVNEDKRLRVLINQGDSGYGVQEKQLTQIQEQLSNISNLRDVSTRIRNYEHHSAEIKKLASEDVTIGYLDQLIKSSQSFELFKTKNFNDLVAQRGSKRKKQVRDNLKAINRSVANGASGAFGNLMGSYEERKGKLYQNREIETIIISHLEAGDILLEKTPFRLTDKMIPGYWGHAAIWIGNEAELRALGIWDHSVVKKYHKEIQARRLVAESLREGTILSTMAHFLNVDDIAVLRNKKPLSDTQKAKLIIITLRQIGKEYDFNFDVETTDKIVCSQLVYLAYTDMKWPTDNILGRFTISPDNIAMKVTDEQGLATLLLYIDGKKIEHDLNKVMLKTLQ